MKNVLPLARKSSDVDAVTDSTTSDALVELKATLSRLDLESLQYRQVDHMLKEQE